MITRQITPEFGLAYQIAKCGFGEHIIVGMTTRVACAASSKSSYIRIDFDDLTNLEITCQSDCSYMTDWDYPTLRLRSKQDSVVRDMTYVSTRNCMGGPDFAPQPEECYQNLKRMVMSMFEDLARGD